MGWFKSRDQKWWWKIKNWWNFLERWKTKFENFIRTGTYITLNFICITFNFCWIEQIVGLLVIICLSLTRLDFIWLRACYIYFFMILCVIACVLHILDDIMCYILLYFVMLYSILLWYVHKAYKLQNHVYPYNILSVRFINFETRQYTCAHNE